MGSVPVVINEFLACPTPDEWLRHAIGQQELLLIDHAHCEHKAAASAMALIRQHPEDEILIQRMSRLVREEMRHFEQVTKIASRRGIPFRSLAAGRYARLLRAEVRQSGSERLVDTLIVGAIIEARSCERFACIAPFLDPELADFYRGLLASESRHFLHYLDLARRRSAMDISARIQRFIELETSLIQSPDPEFRFHSGVPA